MYNIACTRKEASCIIGNLFQELVPVCKECRSFPEGVASISTVGGLTLKIATDLTIEGHGDLSGKPTKIRLTDYGFEFYGDITELTRIRQARCVYFG